MNLDHILVVLGALVILCVTYLVAPAVGAGSPKLLDGVLILAGALAGLARAPS